jgi:hypothetical protein
MLKVVRLLSVRGRRTVLPLISTVLRAAWLWEVD